MKPFDLVTKIGSSILNSDLSQLANESRRMLDSGVDFLHLDVMDGRFVPNITFGHPVVKCLRRNIPKPDYFDCHMMVQRPQQWIAEMADAGANLYTFHVEADGDSSETARLVKESGMDVGVAINPKTPAQAVFDLLDLVDVVLVMTVEPGFGGQKFMGDMTEKVRVIRERAPFVNIGVDGGVGEDTARVCLQAGANLIVSGSALVNSPDPARTISRMRSGCL